MSKLGMRIFIYKGLSTYSQNEEGFVKPYSSQMEAVILF